MTKYEVELIEEISYRGYVEADSYQEALDTAVQFLTPDDLEITDVIARYFEVTEIENAESV
jgi:hypothetical protein